MADQKPRRLGPAIDGKALRERLDRMDSETRQAVTSAGGRARAEALTPDERSEIARAGARAANSPSGRARSIVKAWPSMTPAERAEVRRILEQVLAPHRARPAK